MRSCRVYGRRQMTVIAGYIRVVVYYVYKFVTIIKTEILK